DSLELVFKQSKAVAVTSMAFPVGDVNNFVVGSEDGSVYTACRHGSAAGPVDFSHLFISSSFDWTVKLWSTKVRRPPGQTQQHISVSPHSLAKVLVAFLLQSTRPLYSFEDSSDYVYDSMWSPAHPALFACVDLSGRLDLWNLNNDTEVSTHRPSSICCCQSNCWDMANLPLKPIEFLTDTHACNKVESLCSYVPAS
ncbi:hypothetical protein GOODEAATRI_025986, partial [Goodea atripinnis]